MRPGDPAAADPAGIEAPPLLVALLRVGAVLLTTAFAAVVLPTETMARIHEALGLGAFPRAPLVEYLTRSISALYGFHGLLLWLVSTDLRRFRPIVVYLGCTNVALGLMLTAIDVTARLPLWWTLAEGPPVMVIGGALLLLVRRVPRG